MNRRDFIKNDVLGVLAVNFFPETIFVADTKADLVVFGKIFTFEASIVDSRIHRL